MSTCYPTTVSAEDRERYREARRAALDTAIRNAEARVACLARDLAAARTTLDRRIRERGE